MTFNLKLDEDKQSAYNHLNELMQEGKVIEIKTVGTRTNSQNSYLHLCLQYAASMLGETLQYVKQYYYKECANHEIFCKTDIDKVTGEWVYKIRSTRDLTSDEMRLTIERFKDWCATQPAEPFILPEANNEVQIAEAKKIINSNKEFI